MNLIKDNTFLKNIIKVTASNGVSLIASILTGFLVPIIMGVTEYGYYKIFALYATYTTLCHFGFVDGILMRFAGKDYGDLNVQEMRTYTKFFVVFQIIIGGVFIGLVCPFISQGFYFICVMLGINLVIKNITTFYQFVSQATQRFTEMSIRNTLSAVSHVVVVIICWVYYKTTQQGVSHQLYLGLLTLCATILTIWYIITYKNITFGKSRPLKSVKNNIISLFKTGICLTIAFQVANLILVMDRQLVSVLYGVDIYSIYAFAYSIMAVFTTLISATATVLFPMLRQIKAEAAMTRFSTAVSLISMVSCLALIGYYPIYKIIMVFMPNYVESIQYLRIIIPAMLPMGCISIVMFTYFKVLNKNHIYLKCGCVVLAISFVCNMIAQMMFKTPEAISIASVAVSLIWYLIVTRYFVNTYNVAWKKNFAFLILEMVVFYIVAFTIENWLLAVSVQLGAVLLICTVFYKDELGQILRRFRPKTDK